MYCTIVQQTQRGVEFYLKQFPELAGKTFGQARRAFDDAVLCGYMREGKDRQPELHVNCKDSDILEGTDRVIALSQTGECIWRSVPRHQARTAAVSRGLCSIGHCLSCASIEAFFHLL